MIRDKYKPFANASALINFPLGEFDEELNIVQQVTDFTVGLDDAEQRLTLLPALIERLRKLIESHWSTLESRRLPLEPRLFAEVRNLLTRTIAICKLTWPEINSHLLAGRRAECLQLTNASLHLLLSTHVIGMLAAMRPLAGLWFETHRLGLSLEEVDSFGEHQQSCDIRLGRRFYRRIIALQILQPESLSVAEIFFAMNTLESFGEDIIVARDARQIAQQYWFWCASDSDLPPLHMLQIPPVEGQNNNWYFSAYVLIDRLKKEIASERQRFISLSNKAGNQTRQENSRQLVFFEKLLQRYQSPRQRSQEREPSDKNVQIVVGFDSVWHALKNTLNEHPLTWQMLNESIGGCAVFRSAASLQALDVGFVIIMRMGNGNFWSIGLVQWIKAISPQRIEFGAKLYEGVSRSAEIVFLDEDGERQEYKALLLPKKAKGEARQLLVSSGAEVINNFTIINSDKSLRISHARLLNTVPCSPLVNCLQFSKNS